VRIRRVRGTDRCDAASLRARYLPVTPSSAQGSVMNAQRCFLALSSLHAGRTKLENPPELGSVRVLNETSARLQCFAERLAAGHGLARLYLRIGRAVPPGSITCP